MSTLLLDAHGARRRRLRWSGVATAVTFGLLLPFNAVMEERGYGILDLEQAASAAQAERINAALGETGRQAATLSMVVDYFFVAAWVVFMWTACLLLAGRARSAGRPRWASAARGVRGVIVAAALFDIVENGLLLAILNGAPSNLASAATWCATVKLVLLAIASTFLLVAWARLRRASTAPVGTEQGSYAA
jgi:hypothetical protein